MRKDIIKVELGKAIVLRGKQWTARMSAKSAVDFFKQNEDELFAVLTQNNEMPVILKGSDIVNNLL